MLFGFKHIIGPKKKSRLIRWLDSGKYIKKLTIVLYKTIFIKWKCYSYFDNTCQIVIQIISEIKICYNKLLIKILQTWLSHLTRVLILFFELTSIKNMFSVTCGSPATDFVFPADFYDSSSSYAGVLLSANIMQRI